ncbi:NYN domain-containing protein [Massilia varians]|uniref:NYN domain-containing protein n=1 Tax=Massilia varians TaxID=457921 RepID=UPI0025546FE2|nr:NYN domain-containing protein [Massilia varians]MDK6078760.1 NYN domain-containing protein [Massilia varians]
MASSDNISMAVFCDFENVALGVRDANYEKFDIKPVLERLLLKGSIVVKKAYCDWDRYKTFKAPMHEANFELIEIPHVRQSGKNSADIRLVVDALDLCYTKSHVDTFVIVSGDSDFSPLVSKLRENAKRVIGVGVKQSTSDLLVANCDEFIFYDDLVREKNRAAAKRKEELDARRGQPAARRPSDDKRREELEARKAQALEMVVETFDALVSERGDTGKIWASLLKDTLKRRRPDFSETFYGFRTFGNLLEEAQARGLFDFGRDEKSGTYVFRSAAAPVAMPAPELVVVPDTPVGEEAAAVQGGEEAPQSEAKPERGRRGRGGRGGRGREAASAVPELSAVDAALAAELPAGPAATEEAAAEAPPAEETVDAVAGTPVEEVPAEPAPAPVKERRRAPRKPAAKKAAAEAPAVEAAADLPAPTVALDSAADMPASATEAAADTATDTALDAGDAADADGDADAKAARKKTARPAHKAPARKTAPRGRRPAKPKTPAENG